MSKRGRKTLANGRSAGESRHVRLPHFMLRCAAWMTLTPNAKAVLLAVWERHNGLNNGEISYAVREAAAIGLSKDQASRAFAQLTERGFLKINRNSKFDLKTKEARTWELTAEPSGGNLSSKDFMRWSAPAPENKTRSHQRDAQSHQRDTNGADVIKLPVSVAPARPSRPILTLSQSHQRDTYILPEGGASQPTRSSAPPIKGGRGDATEDGGLRSMASVLPRMTEAKR